MRIRTTKPEHEWLAERVARAAGLYDQARRIEAEAGELVQAVYRCIFEERDDRPSDGDVVTMDKDEDGRLVLTWEPKQEAEADG